MYKYIIFLIFCISLNKVYAGLDQGQISRIQQYHNQWRSNPNPSSKSQIPNLQWSNAISSKLQRHADRCNGQYSPDALYSINSEWLLSSMYSFNLDDSMNAVYNTYKDYDWNVKSCKPGKACLYAVSMWKNSTQFGCALSKCGNIYNFFCDYYPSGGYQGIPPYEAGSNTQPTQTPTQTSRPTQTPTQTQTQTPRPTQTQTQTQTPTPTQTQTQTPRPTQTQTQTQTPTQTPTQTNGGAGGVAPIRGSGGTVDWTNVMTPVRNQGSCGSCWSFSAIGNVEAYAVIQKGANRNTLDLSEQQCVNCLSPGCVGGWFGTVWQDFLSSGVNYESDVPYTGYKTGCRSPSGNTFKWKGSTFLRDTQTATIVAQLQNGPVSVGMMADGPLNSYRSGIYSCSTAYRTQNHAVLIVGYNADQNYWIIKNTWGTSWGESGYFRLTNNNDNCFVKGYLGGYAVL